MRPRPATHARRLRRSLAALGVAVVVALLAPALALAGPGEFATGLQDPLDPAFKDPDPAHAYPMARSERVRYVRVATAWGELAPFSRPKHPTNFNDPAYRWGWLDARLGGIRSNGMEPIVVLYATPGWAQYGNGLTPRVGDFAAFVQAIATRYDGRHGLPRVRYFQIWNEPNIVVYLGRKNAPQNYRALVNAAYPRIHAAARDNVVIAGGQGPIGGRLSMAPLEFMRQVLCLSKGRRPHATCNATTSFDVWSHHPYNYGGPNHHADHPDDVMVGDLGKMRSLLTAARRVHHLVPDRAPRFWVTEFSWDTKAPDPGGVPLKRHARWVAEAFYRMWAQGVSTVVWFQLRDSPEGQGWGYTWQAGLFPRTTTLYANERAKPVARVVRFPFAAVPSGRRVVVWGRTPDGKRHKVLIQRRVRKKWRKVATLRSGAHGVFVSKRRRLAGKLLRAKVGRSTALPFKAVRTKDQRVRPFGGPPNG